LTIQPLRVAAVNGASADKLRGVRIPANAGIAGEVLRTGQALRIRSAEDRERIYRDVENVSLYHALDIVAVPLKLGSEILGVMEAVHSQPYSFTDDDLRLLESAGSWAAIAIGNARQHQRLQRRLREREAIAAIGRALNETLDLDHVLQLIVSSARQIIPKANMASTLLLDETRHVAYAVTESGRTERYLGEQQATLHTDPLGEMVERAGCQYSRFAAVRWAMAERHSGNARCWLHRPWRRAASGRRGTPRV
jgi:GAF domain-containing protein